MRALLGESRDVEKDGGDGPHSFSCCAGGGRMLRCCGRLAGLTKPIQKDNRVMNSGIGVSRYLPLLLAMLIACAPVHAGMLGTSLAIDPTPTASLPVDVERFLLREDVRAQLEALGVAPAEAAERAARLSPTELATLQQRIDALPAGGIVEVIGVVFVVLLVLELVGVTNVFTGL